MEKEYSNQIPKHKSIDSAVRAVEEQPVEKSLLFKVADGLKDLDGKLDKAKDFTYEKLLVTTDKLKDANVKINRGLTRAAGSLIELKSKIGTSVENTVDKHGKSIAHFGKIAAFATVVGVLAYAATDKASDKILDMMDDDKKQEQNLDQKSSTTDDKKTETTKKEPEVRKRVVPRITDVEK